MSELGSAAYEEAILRRIGEVMRAAGPAAAFAAARAALASGNDGDRLLGLAAMLAWRSGDPAAAIPLLRTLLERHPDDRATRLNLAAALTERGDGSEVDTLLAPLGGDLAADRLRAFAAQQRGEPALAEDLYRGVVARKPDDAESWNNLGNAIAARGDIDASVRAFERAITLRPDDARIYLNLAGVLEKADRRAARLRVTRDAARRAPNDPDVLLALGLAQAIEGLHDEAEAAFRRAIDLAPHAPAAYLELAMLLERHNRLDELAALAEQAGTRIGDESSLIAASAALRAKRYDEAHRLAAGIPASINPIRRLELTAQIADRRAAYAEAFALYDQMNAAALAAAPAVPAGPTYRESVAANASLLAAIGAAEAQAATPSLPVEPIFIAGFPRSGTTLLDALLGALPDTLVLEERRPLPAAEQAAPVGVCAMALDDAEADRLRARYFETLAAIEPAFASQRLIDKHPLHMARVPLLHRLFPTAPILLVERHPYDVVLSCFMANFELNHAMRSFVTIEEAARTYDAVFAAWTAAEARLPLRVHRVRYERLVEQPTTELAAVLAFLDIDADPAALDHQSVARERGFISTASYAQVTEPLHRRSVARWRDYADQLAPVLPVLRPWAKRMGYEVD